MCRARSESHSSCTPTQHHKRTPVSFSACVGAVGRSTPPGSPQMFSEPRPGSTTAGLLGQAWLPGMCNKNSHLCSFFPGNFPVKVHPIEMTNCSPASISNRLRRTGRWKSGTGTQPPLPSRTPLYFSLTLEESISKPRVKQSDAACSDLRWSLCSCLGENNSNGS